MQGNARRLGAALLEGLKKLQKKFTCIGDVRGRGLMVGIELVTGDDRTPASELAADVLETCKQMGLILGKGGYFGNVLRVKPPLCLTDADIRFMLEVFDAAFAKETA